MNKTILRHRATLANRVRFARINRLRVSPEILATLAGVTRLKIIEVEALDYSKDLKYIEVEAICRALNIKVREGTVCK